MQLSLWPGQYANSASPTLPDKFLVPFNTIWPKWCVAGDLLPLPERGRGVVQREDAHHLPNNRSWERFEQFGLIVSQWLIVIDKIIKMKMKIWNKPPASIFPGARSEEGSAEKEEEESEDQAKLWYLCRSRRTFLFWLFADIFKPAWYISYKGGNGGNIDIEKRNIQYVTQHLIITSAFYANNVCVKRIEKIRCFWKLFWNIKWNAELMSCICALLLP